MKGLFTVGVFAVSLVALFAACGGDTSEEVASDQGTLSGTITIGPDCTVEPCDQPAGAVYVGRKLVLLRSGAGLINVPLGNDGSFSVSLEPATYVIRLDACNFSGCDEAFPVEKTIAAGQTVTLNVDLEIRSAASDREIGLLISDMVGFGAVVGQGGVTQSVFSVPGRETIVDGETVLVFAYDSPKAAQADADLVSASGAAVGTTSVLWTASPHFYLRDSLLVLYVGDDGGVIGLLQDVLGPQFAGSDQAMPDPTPAAVVPALTGLVPAEEAFKALLTVSDVESHLTTAVRLDTDFADAKAAAEEVDPAQVVNMDSWYGLVFEAAEASKGMTFMVIDFNSEDSARDHFENVVTGTPGIQEMAEPIGDDSSQMEVNAQGIGSMVVFKKGDSVVMLLTAQAEGTEPLVDAEGVIALARLAAGRL